MKYTIASALLLLSLSSQVSAQSNPLDKKLDKVYELIKEEKIDKAETYLSKMMDQNPDYGRGWDLLYRIRYKQYEQVKALGGLMDNIKMTVKDEKGKEIKDDSLSQQLSAMLRQVSPSKMAYNKFLYTLRQATISSKEAYLSSQTLRQLYIDVEVDTNVSTKALKYYREAEEEFEAKNYNKAASLYKRSLEIQPDFYKARLYLGDCYYFTQNYSEAINVFKEATNRFPTFLEPRKYLVDAYYKASLYDKALEQAVYTTTIYPDFAMIDKLTDAAYANNKKMYVQWAPRSILPNTIYDDSTIKFDEKNEPKAPEGHWIHYINAKKAIKPYCDNKGIVYKANSLTKAKYLEVYSWEEMLKNSKDPALEDARKMQELGYLDCYVLVSCFHIDFYDQYKNFVANNRDKIIKYY